MIKQPLYVKNDLCLDSSARIDKAAGSVRVGGKINMNSSATIGASGAGNELLELHVAGAGCARGNYATTNTAAYTWPCTTTHQVYATTQTQDPGTVTKPDIDLVEAYNEVQPSAETCTGTPPVFDTNTTMGDRSSNVNLLPSSSYSCTFPGGGSLTWNRTSSPDVPTVSGTIFVDGNLYFGGSSVGVVSGRGVIYASGKITFDSSMTLCGAWSSSTGTCGWTSSNPEANLLMLVAGHDTGTSAEDQYGFTATSSAHVQAAVYAVRDFRQDSSSEWQGPALARQLDFDSSVSNAAAWTAMTTLPDGAPVVAGEVTPVTGSWRG